YVYERHRHRYELNNEYREQLAKLGMVCSGLSPDYRLVEIIEIPLHPYFIATQFHPEFRSRPNNAHPLFHGLIAAAVERTGRLCAPETEPIEAADDADSHLTAVVAASGRKAANGKTPVHTNG